MKNTRTVIDAAGQAIEVPDPSLPFDPGWEELRDAADPGAPGLLGWEGPVQGYPNRTPPWTQADFDRFTHGVMRTSVHPDPAWALVCREIDAERFAAGPKDIPPFIDRRESAGFGDAGAYFSLDLWPKVRPVLKAAGIVPARIRLRIADWTGTPRKIDLGDGYQAWAHQFENVPALGMDRTAVWGARDWSRR